MVGLNVLDEVFIRGGGSICGMGSVNPLILGGHIMRLICPMIDGRVIISILTFLRWIKVLVLVIVSSHIVSCKEV